MRGWPANGLAFVSLGADFSDFKNCLDFYEILVTLKRILLMLHPLELGASNLIDKCSAL